MSYCRFENTAQDLRDCEDALQGNPGYDDMSEQELEAVWELRDLGESINSMRDGVECHLEDSARRRMEGDEDLEDDGCVAWYRKD